MRLVCAFSVVFLLQLAAACAAAFGSPTVEELISSRLTSQKVNNQLLWTFTGISKKKEASKTPPKFHEKTPEREHRETFGAPPFVSLLLLLLLLLLVFLLVLLFLAACCFCCCF